MFIVKIIAGTQIIGVLLILLFYQDIEVKFCFDNKKKRIKRFLKCYFLFNLFLFGVFILYMGIYEFVRSLY